MKNSLTLFLALIISLPALGQRILIADNTASAPVGDHIYASLQDAIDDSQEGDVVQVVPSPTSYGNIIIPIEKSGISILGSGYNPNQQHISIVNTAQINADNINISGMTFEGLLLIENQGVEFPRVKNIIIRNSSINDGFRIYRSSNVITSSCFIQFSGSSDITQFSERIIITNSIIADYFQNIENTTLSNSIILHNGNARLTNSFSSNSLYNNIILTNLSAGNIFASSVFLNNYSLIELNIGLNSNSGSGNIIDSDATTETVFLQDGNGWLQNFNPTLIEGSTLIGAGSDGTDIGVFGGGGTYSRTGVVLPYIQEIQAPLTFKVGSIQEVTIKASGN